MRDREKTIVKEFITSADLDEMHWVTNMIKKRRDVLQSAEVVRAKGKRVLYKSESGTKIPATIERYTPSIYKYKIVTDYGQILFVPKNKLEWREDANTETGEGSKRAEEGTNQA
jgi:hypothetical protein